MNKVETLLDDLMARLEQAAAAREGDRDVMVAGLRGAVEPLVAELRDAVASEINQLTQLDPATSVLNSRALEDAADAEFSRALRYRRDLSAVRLAVAGFPGIREAQGAGGGDTFLRTMILDCCRGIRACDIVGRTAMATFTILLPETPLAGAVQVAQRLRTILRDTLIPVGSDEVFYTINVGVATADSEDVGAAPLLERTSEALRIAREAGPDGIIVARQASLEDEPPCTAEDPESDFHKALGSVSVDYVPPEEL
ncbi:MAG: diguanylate cyclase [Pseudomonadota bacterium]